MKVSFFTLRNNLFTHGQYKTINTRKKLHTVPFKLSWVQCRWPLFSVLSQWHNVDEQKHKEGMTSVLYAYSWSACNMSIHEGPCTIVIEHLLQQTKSLRAYIHGRHVYTSADLEYAPLHCVYASMPTGVNASSTVLGLMGPHLSVHVRFSATLVHE